tara:strand:- start:130 stop:309 length:180 start_codon:yes stop_codon:yes gene_type:complete
MERILAKEKKIKSLISKHEFFDTLIQEKEKYLSSDCLEISDLKKRKLKIKDEIKRLNSH